MKLHPLSLNDADNKLIVLSSEALFLPGQSPLQIKLKTKHLVYSILPTLEGFI